MKKIIGLFALTGLVFMSCEKQGCMDPVSNNLDSSANTSRGCMYTGNVQFWMNGQTAANLSGAGYDQVDVYFIHPQYGEKHAGTVNTVDFAGYTDPAPECGVLGLNVQEELGPTNPGITGYQVRSIPDAAGNFFILNSNDSIALVADSCNKVQIVF